MERIFRVESDEVSFRCGLRGAHPTTIFLHGFGGDLYTWSPLWEALPHRTDMLRYDLRGFGETRNLRDVAFTHTEDLIDLMDCLRIPAANLVGVSLGGGVALNCALSFPERVKKLVLISPGMVAWEWSNEWKALWLPIVELARRGDMDKARELWWQHPLFASTRAGAAKDLLYEAIQRYDGRQWVKDFESPAMPDVDRLHTLNTDTLLLTGELDVDEFRTIANIIEASSQCVQRIHFPGSGHLLHVENPPDCADAINNFI